MYVINLKKKYLILFAYFKRLCTQPAVNLSRFVNCAGYFKYLVHMNFIS